MNEAIKSFLSLLGACKGIKFVQPRDERDTAWEMECM